MIADIENEVKVGMNIMGTNGFQLGLKLGVLQINEKEVILHPRQEEAVRMVLLEEPVIPEGYERVSQACLRCGTDRGRVMTFESQLDVEHIGRRIAIWKGLV